MTQKSQCEFALGVFGAVVEVSGKKVAHEAAANIVDHAVFSNVLA